MSTRTAPLPHSATSDGAAHRRAPAARGAAQGGRHLARGGLHPARDPQAQHGADDAERAVKNSAPGEPHSAATPAATPPATPPATKPNVVSRELVVTSVIALGSTRGVTAALSTTNVLLSTIAPSAAGYSSQLS